MKKIFLTIFILFNVYPIYCQCQYWNTTGNSGITTTNFLGTTDSTKLILKSNSIEFASLTNSGNFTLSQGYKKRAYNTYIYDVVHGQNVFIGDSSGLDVTYTSIDSLTSHNCVSLGINAMKAAKINWGCTAIGAFALAKDTGRWGTNNPWGGGYENTAVGSFSMYNTLGVKNPDNNQSGQENTAVGVGSMMGNTIGGRNSALGLSALWESKTGYENTAIGANSLCYGTRLTSVAVGAYSQQGSAGVNNIAYSNSSLGYRSMYAMKNGYYNVSVGYENLKNGASGYENTSVGMWGLYNNNTYRSTSIGFASGFNATGHHFVGIGFSAGRYCTDGTDSIFIGNKDYGNKYKERNCTPIIIYAPSATDSSLNRIRLSGVPTYTSQAQANSANSPGTVFKILVGGLSILAITHYWDNTLFDEEYFRR